MPEKADSLFFSETRKSEVTGGRRNPEFWRESGDAQYAGKGAII
jgi:hypothetical protein